MPIMLRAFSDLMDTIWARVFIAVLWAGISLILGPMALLGALIVSLGPDRAVSLEYWLVTASAFLGLVGIVGGWCRVFWVGEHYRQSATLHLAVCCALAAGILGTLAGYFGPFGVEKHNIPFLPVAACGVFLLAGTIGARVPRRAARE